MSSQGDYIPGDAISPLGIMNLKVILAEREGGALQIMLRVTEADGTLHFFPLGDGSSTTRMLADRLLKVADALDSGQGE